MAKDKPCCPDCAEEEARSAVMARYQDGGPVLPDLDRERRANFFRLSGARRDRRAAERAARMSGDRPVPRGVALAEGLADAPQYAFDYLSETPVSEMVSDVKGLGAGIVEAAREDPAMFLAETFVPGVGQYMGYKDYMELTAQAEQARAAGDTETADELNALASFVLTSSLVPGGRTAAKPVVMGAVKPRGGVFGSRTTPDNRLYASSLPELLDEYEAGLIREGMSESDAKMVVEKARKFYTTEFGTESDRLRQMMRDEVILGKTTPALSGVSSTTFGVGLEPFIQKARTADVLRGEQIAPVRAEFERLLNMRSRSGQFDGFDTIEDYNKFIAARNELDRLTRVDAPDVQPTDAMRAFESQYDRATGLKGLYVGDDVKYPGPVLDRLQEEVARESQYPNRLPNMQVINDPINPKYDHEKITGFDFVNDPTYARAIENQEIIYDINPSDFSHGLRFLKGTQFPEAVAELELSSDELAKISFPELVRRSVNTNTPAQRARNATRSTRDILGNFYSRYPGTSQVPEKGLDELLNRVPRGVKLEGLEEVLPGPEKTWHRITDANWTQLEGAMMGHSVGGYAKPGSSYNLGGRKAFDEGTARVYTLRDNVTGNPRLTVDVDFSDPSNPQINQVHGPNDHKVLMKDIDDLYALFDELKIDPDEGFRVGSGRQYQPSYKFYKDTDAAFTPEALSRRQEEQLLFAEPEGPAEQRGGFEPEQVRAFQRGQDPLFGPDEVQPLDTPDPQQERRRAGIRSLFGLNPDDN